MNEKELKAAEGKLKAAQDEFTKKVETQSKLFEEDAKRLDANKEEFAAYIDKTERQFKEADKSVSTGDSSSKGCYRDSSFWKSEEGIALKAKQAKK